MGIDPNNPLSLLQAAFRGGATEPAAAPRQRAAAGAPARVAR